MSASDPPLPQFRLLRNLPREKNHYVSGEQSREGGETRQQGGEAASLGGSGLGDTVTQGWHNDSELTSGPPPRISTCSWGCLAGNSESEALLAVLHDHGDAVQHRQALPAPPGLPEPLSEVLRMRRVL